MESCVGSAATTAVATDMFSKVRAWQMCEARRRRDLEFNFSAGPTRIACPKPYLRLLRLKAQHFLPDADGTRGIPLHELEARHIRTMRERFEEEQRRVHGDNWRETTGFTLYADGSSSNHAAPAARSNVSAAAPLKKLAVGNSAPAAAATVTHTRQKRAAAAAAAAAKSRDFPVRTIHGRLARPATAKLFRQSTAVDLDQSMLRARHAKGARPQSAMPTRSKPVTAAEVASSVGVGRREAPAAVPVPVPATDRDDAAAASSVAFAAPASVVCAATQRPAAAAGIVDVADIDCDVTTAVSHVSVEHRMRALEESLSSKREQRERVTSEVRDIRRNIATINQLLMTNQREQRHLK